MAALFTDAFNFIVGVFFWKDDGLLAGRTLCTAGSQRPGLFLVYVTLIFLLGFIAVLQLSLASCSKCHNNLLILCFNNKAK